MALRAPIEVLLPGAGPTYALLQIVITVATWKITGRYASIARLSTMSTRRKYLMGLGDFLGSIDQGFNGPDMDPQLRGYKKLM